MDFADQAREENWVQPDVPANVRVGAGSIIKGDYVTGNLAFKRFRSRRDPALVIGDRCVLDGVFFNLAESAFVQIGNECHFQDAFLICESELRIGHRVKIGWHVTVVDADFHPVDPAQRLADVVALSPLGGGAPRPPHVTGPILIGDDVWIGPNATILKGVRIGAGAVIEPGAVVTRDVQAETHVTGNPARAVSAEFGRE